MRTWYNDCLRRMALLLLVAAVGCSGDSSECENTLTLDQSDNGGMRTISDGCTSVVVVLPVSTGEWEYTPTASNGDVLRFDYRTQDPDLVQYYFTPLASGTTDITIRDSGAVDLENAWLFTLEVVLGEM